MGTSGDLYIADSVVVHVSDARQDGRIVVKMLGQHGDEVWDYVRSSPSLLSDLEPRATVYGPRTECIRDRHTQ